MNVLDDWLLDLIIWEEVTDPYELRSKKHNTIRHPKEQDTEDGGRSSTGQRGTD